MTVDTQFLLYRQVSLPDCTSIKIFPYRYDFETCTATFDEKNPTKQTNKPNKNTTKNKNTKSYTKEG